MSVEREYLKAGNPQTPSDELRELFALNNAKVRRRVAENANCPRDLFKLMAEDSDEEVRIAVALNQKCPAKLRQRLAEDESVFVRYELAEDPTMPIKLLNRLAEDENAYVKDQAQRTIAGIALEKALNEIGFVIVEGHSQRLGEMLVHAKKVRQEQLDQYLRIARDSNMPLGRVLAQTRVLPRHIIVMALTLQSKIRRNELSVEDGINQLRLAQ